MVVNLRHGLRGDLITTVVITLSWGIRQPMLVVTALNYDLDYFKLSFILAD